MLESTPDSFPPTSVKFSFDPMSLASEKLETIRQQVQYHLDVAEDKQLSPAQERALCDTIKARLQAENAVLIFDPQWGRQAKEKFPESPGWYILVIVAIAALTCFYLAYRLVNFSKRNREG